MFHTSTCSHTGPYFQKNGKFWRHMPLLALSLRKMNDLGITPELCFHALVLQPNVSGSMPQSQLDSGEVNHSTCKNSIPSNKFDQTRVRCSVGKQQRPGISKANKHLHTTRTLFRWTLNWTYLFLSQYLIVSHNLLRHLDKVITADHRPLCCASNSWSRQGLDPAYACSQAEE